MSNKVKIVIPGRPEFLTMLRLSIGSLADIAGFDIDETEDIKTAVGEAARNVYCHGLTGYAQEYTIECEIGEGSIEVFITDTSAAHEKEKLSPRCKDCPNEGDLSIFVIRSIMDEVEIICSKDEEEGKKTIRMLKRKQR